MNQNTTEEELSPQEKLRKYLDKKGIRQTHVSYSMGKQRNWIAQVLLGNIRLDEPLQKKIEEVLEAKIF